MDDLTPIAIPQNPQNSVSKPNACGAVHEGDCAACGGAGWQGGSAAASGPEGSEPQVPSDGEDQQQAVARGGLRADSVPSECSWSPKSPLPYDAVNGLETAVETLVSYDQTRGRSLLIDGRISWVDGDQGNALLKNQGRALRRVLTILAARNAPVPTDSRNDEAGEPKP